MSPRIVGLYAGRAQTFGVPEANDPLEREWRTAFHKERVASSMWCGPEGLVGDEQANRVDHGGPEKAVLAYAHVHYAAWAAEIGLPSPADAGFGENLAITGMSEHTVCIGDVYEIGGAVLQVSQPRGPCWKIARRWRIKDLVARVLATRRTGWYLRVLREGAIEPGQHVRLTSRMHPEWTIARAIAAAYDRTVDPQDLARLAELPELAPEWRGKIIRRIQDGAVSEPARERRADPAAR